MAEIAIAGATAVLRQAAAVLGNLVVQEGSRLFRLTEDLEWIENEMRYIRAYLEDIEDKQWESRGVTNLVRNIWDIAYDVEDIVNTYFPKLASSGKNCRKGRVGWLRSTKFIINNYKTARDFAVEIEGIKRRVDDIERVRRTYGIQERTGRDAGDKWDPRRSFPHLDEVNVVGFDEHIEELVARVVDEDLEHRVVSVIGMAGLGKTTLAKKVYNSVRRKFECSAWICVSQQPNIAELLRDIARQVGLEKEKWEHNLVGNLFTFLSEKRYVIVIDDLWQAEHWDDGLKNGIPINSVSGSRIILTSRNKYVGVHVGGQNSLHELRPLDLDNCRNLFFKKVGGPQPSDPPLLKEVGEKILRRCGGVPLAILLTASMLLQRERTEYAWKGVLENMGQEEDQCSKIFALSYKDLPAKLKSCFLCFGLFPEDCKIPAFDLINLWVAERFIQRDNGGREVEEMGEEYLNHLIARNLIQVAQRRFDGRVRSCRIHDILHSLCVREAKEINIFNTHNDLVTGNSALRVRRATTSCRSLLEYISLDYRTPKLRTMLCFDTEEHGELKRKHVKNFLGDSTFLRVLFLEFEFLEISLPSEIGKLSHLSYIRLKVRRGRIKLPSTICNLPSLLTLDCRGCNNLVIPDSIWKMKQLRHILLPRCYDIKYDFGVLLLNVGKLLHPIETSPNLQTLYMLRVGWWPIKFRFPNFTNIRKLGVSFWYEEFSNLKALLDGTILPQKLEILRLEALIRHEITMPYNVADLNLSCFENLFRLHLVGRVVELPKHDKLPPNLTKLTLKRTYLSEDPMETLKQLPKLKILKLDTASYVGEKMTVCSGGRGEEPSNFPQLEVLEIINLPSLKELMLAEEVMPRLKKLTFTYCNDPVTLIPNRIRNIMATK